VSFTVIRILDSFKWGTYTRRQQPTARSWALCWVLYGVYRGEIEITTYRRLDDGNDKENAGLEKKELHRLTPGVVYPYLGGEIHSTRAVEAPSVVFRFLSYDLNRVERHRYNSADWTVSPA